MQHLSAHCHGFAGRRGRDVRFLRYPDHAPPGFRSRPSVGVSVRQAGGARSKRLTGTGFGSQVTSGFLGSSEFVGATLKQVGEVCELRIQPQSAGFTGRAVLMGSRVSEPIAVVERIQKELELVKNQH